MSINLDTDRARREFIEMRRAVVDQAEAVADGRARGTLSVAALDRLVVDVEAFQNARRKFITLNPE